MSRPKGYRHTAASRAKMSKASRHRYATDPSYREKLSESQRRLWLDPSYREKISKKNAASQRRIMRTGKIDPRPCEICAGHQRRGCSLARDHDHELGHQRGLLCSRCNRCLGNFERALDGGIDRGYPATDAWMFSALRYLKKHGSNWRVA